MTHLQQRKERPSKPGVVCWHCNERGLPARMCPKKDNPQLGKEGFQASASQRRTPQEYWGAPTGKGNCKTIGDDDHSHEAIREGFLQTLQQNTHRRAADPAAKHHSQSVRQTGQTENANDRHGSLGGSCCTYTSEAERLLCTVEGRQQTADQCNLFTTATLLKRWSRWLSW